MKHKRFLSRLHEQKSVPAVQKRFRLNFCVSSKNDFLQLRTNKERIVPQDRKRAWNHDLFEKIARLKSLSRNFAKPLVQLKALKPCAVKSSLDFLHAVGKFQRFQNRVEHKRTLFDDFHTVHKRRSCTTGGEKQS